MTELPHETCPFCGTDLLLFHDDGRDVDEWRCMGCGHREGVPATGRRYR